MHLLTIRTSPSTSSISSCTGKYIDVDNIQGTLRNFETQIKSRFSFSRKLTKKWVQEKSVKSTEQFGIKPPQFGEPLEVLELVHRKKPRASPHHVVVRITVRPVHPSDFIPVRRGDWAKLPSENLTVGIEGFGTIEEVGDKVTKFKPKQRVVPLPPLGLEYYETGKGFWRDFVEVHESNVMKVPDSICDESAAQMVINPWTAYGLLSDSAVPKGEYLLQTAAGSVIGRQIIQLAKHWGIKTINLVRRDNQKQELKDLGADEVISTSSEDVVARVKEITGGKGAYAAIDAVAGDLTKTVSGSVRNGGQVFIYGALGGSMDYTSSIMDLARNVVINFWIIAKFINTLEKRALVADEVLNLLDQGIIVPLSGKKFPLENFRDAIVESETQARGGKVLLVS